MTLSEAIPNQITRAGWKTTAILFVAQSLSSAAIIATATVMPIIGDDLSGNPSWAGVPFAMVQLAAAPAAFVWGLLWDRTGRRNGLSVGILVGLVGMALGVVGIQAGSFWLFLAALVGIGGSRAAVQLSRFIAAEVNPPISRGRAISYVVLGGTVGAIGGPLLVAPSSRWALGLGLPEMAGPFAISVALLGLATFVVWLGLRPEPMHLSREVAALFPETDQITAVARPIAELVRLPGVYGAMVAMVLAQMVMVMVMGITSLYMKDHNHALGSISLVISAHTLGMYAFSILSGRLADRWGRGPVILCGALLMILALILAPISTQVAPLAVALFFLGLGWNLCFVAGSALLADHLTLPERSRTQGFNDLLIGVVSAMGSFSSGVVFAAMGYLTVNLVGGAFVVAILALTGYWLVKQGSGRLWELGRGGD
ncbi:MAG: MFS transporter [Anaerolineales bacterium]|jgi:MFS family permease